jgi:hypothetical protein
MSRAAACHNGPPSLALIFNKGFSMNIPSSFKFSLAALATAGAALAPAVSHAQT